MSKESVKKEKLDIPIWRPESPESVYKIAYKRRRQILNLVKKVGIAGAREREKNLAKTYEVSERTIRRDLKWIKGNFKPADLREVVVNLRVLRDRSIQKALQIVEDAQTPEQQKEAVRLALDTIGKVREDLEEWSEKPKVAEKHRLELSKEEIPTKIVILDPNQNGNRVQTDRETEGSS